MSGLVNIFTRFEKLEISSAYAFSIGGTYTVTLNFKNTGSAAASISDILVNGIPVSQMLGNVTSAQISINNGKGVEFASTTALPPVPCNVGDEGKLILTAPAKSPGKSTFVSGVSIEVRLHIAAGKDYP
jgi:PKD repeat protein